MVLTVCVSAGDRYRFEVDACYLVLFGLLCMRLTERLAGPGRFLEP